MVWATPNRNLREKLKLLPTILSEHNSNKNMIVSFLCDSKIKTHFQRMQGYLWQQQVKNQSSQAWNLSVNSILNIHLPNKNCFLWVRGLEWGMGETIKN